MQFNREGYEKIRVTKIALIKKAWANQEFINELQKNTKAVFEKQLGEEFAEDFEIKLYENTDRETFLVFPAKTVIPFLPTPTEDKSLKNAFLKVILRANEDSEFKEEFLKNPKLVLEKELEMKLLDVMEYKVLEDSENLMNFVLPQPPKSSGELTQEELEKITGAGAIIKVDNHNMRKHEVVIDWSGLWTF